MEATKPGDEGTQIQAPRYSLRMMSKGKGCDGVQSVCEFGMNISLQLEMPPWETSQLLPGGAFLDEGKELPEGTLSL